MTDDEIDDTIINAAIAEVATALRDGVAAGRTDHLPERLAGPLRDAIRLTREGHGVAVAAGLRLGVAAATPDGVPLPPRPGALSSDEDDEPPTAA